MTVGLQVEGMVQWGARKEGWPGQGGQGMWLRPPCMCPVWGGRLRVQDWQQAMTTSGKAKDNVTHNQ